MSDWAEQEMIRLLNEIAKRLEKLEQCVYDSRYPEESCLRVKRV